MIDGGTQKRCEANELNKIISFVERTRQDKLVDGCKKQDMQGTREEEKRRRNMRERCRCNATRQTDRRVDAMMMMMDDSTNARGARFRWVGMGWRMLGKEAGRSGFLAVGLGGLGLSKSAGEVLGHVEVEVERARGWVVMSVVRYAMNVIDEYAMR